MAEQGKPLSTFLHQLADDTGEAIDTLRDLARGIYPPLLAAEGLPAALRAQARKTTLPVSVDAEGVGRYSQDVEAAVYFCCLEALQNVVKYAGAATAVITLRADDGLRVFAVSDDGQGFDPAHTLDGAGLQNMADRVDALDGAFQIIAAPGRGTTITGRVPLADVTRSAAEAGALDGLTRDRDDSAQRAEPLADA
jgi:two-component system, NarL family, sensor kinase